MERQVTRFGAAGEQFRIVSGHVRALRGHFELLSDAIGGVHSRLSNLLPALGGLASITSVAGVFHLVEKVSERRNESIKTARDLGITTSQLGAIDYAAAVSDVDSGTVETGVAARAEPVHGRARQGQEPGRPLPPSAPEVARLAWPATFGYRRAAGHSRRDQDTKEWPAEHAHGAAGQSG
jgi:hypothetical protein